MMRSLQQFCLNVITYNFDTFHSAYSTTEDATLKLKLEFLRRVYSFQIVTRLQMECSLKEEYLEFVINKYLKTLNTNWFFNCSWDAITKRLSEVGPTFENVIFNGDENPWENIICYLTNLKCVSYEDCCNDKILHAIAKFCPKIESINVKNSPAVSDDGIKHLCYNEVGQVSCSVLKELEIEHTSVGDDGIKHLVKNLPSLEKIDYEKLSYVLYSIHKDDINNLGNLNPYNITHLNLNKINKSLVTDDIFKVCIAVCPYLKSLSYPVYMQEHLAFCNQFSKLEELHLDCCTESRLSINSILKLKGNKLLSLKLRYFTVSVSTLVQSCPRLISLELDLVTFKCNDNESVPVLHNVESISFEKLNMLDDVTIHAMACLLSSSPNLKNLRLAYCKMSSADGETCILKCCEECKLEYVDFSYSDVDFKFLQAVLLTCSSLKSLNLEGCDTTQKYSMVQDLESLAYMLPNRPLLLYGDNFFYDSSDSDDYYNVVDDDDDFYDEYSEDDDDDEYYAEEEDDDDDDPYPI